MERTIAATTTLHTPFCEQFGLRYPIIKAPMPSGPDTLDLIAAVSEAGGLGVLGAVLLKPDQLRATIRAIKDRTARPFGVNLFLMPPEPGNQDLVGAQNFLDRLRAELQIPAGRVDLTSPLSRLADQLEVIFDERVPVLSTQGDPSSVIAAAHGAGTQVLATVTTVEEAIQAATAGADAVVAQGAEAGGMRGTFRLGPDGEAALVGTLALVPQVVDAVPVPVVAAGGIMDGRGLVAALALGAAGVMLGTRFLVARESGIFPDWRERLLTASELDAVITRAATGRPARMLRNRLTEAYSRANTEPLAFPLQAAATADIYAAAVACGNADYLYLAAGQGLRLLKRDQPAAKIVAELIAGAEAVLARWTAGADAPDRPALLQEHLRA